MTSQNMLHTKCLPNENNRWLHLYLNLTNKSILIERLSYDLNDFCKLVIGSLFLGYPVYFFGKDSSTKAIFLRVTNLGPSVDWIALG